MRPSVVCTFLSQTYCAAMVTCSYGPNDTGPHGMAIYATKLGANILTTSHMSGSKKGNIVWKYNSLGTPVFVGQVNQPYEQHTNHTVNHIKLENRFPNVPLLAILRVPFLRVPVVLVEWEAGKPLMRQACPGKLRCRKPSFSSFFLFFVYF